MPYRVSIVGQDRSSLEAIARNLTQVGCICSVASDNEDSTDLLLEQAPDIVLVESDSYAHIAELARRIKENTDLPILGLVRGELLSRVNDHFNDVDDFVTRPYPADELQLRMRRLLRQAGSGGEEHLSCGDLELDLAKCEVSVGGREIVLTFKEYELLKFMVSNQGRVCTRDVLLDKVWGHDYYGGDRTVDVHIRRLRSKIEDTSHSFIDTVRNIGYRLRS